MKKALIFVALLAETVGAYAQGQVIFSDFDPPSAGTGPGGEFSITVWSPQTQNPTIELTGNGSDDLPIGTQTGYTGTPIGGGNMGTGPKAYGNGNNYSIALYAAPGANDSVSSLMLVPGAITTFDTSGGANPSSGFAGQWDVTSTVTVTVPDVAAGETGTFQLRAWYSGGGDLTYAAAQADPFGIFGESLPVNLTLSSTDTPGSLNPIQSFSLTGVPEPGTFAFGIMSFSVLWARRCKCASLR